MTATQAMLHIQKEWVWYVIAGILGTEILIRATKLIASISGGVPPLWVDSTPAYMAYGSILVIGIPALALALLWRRSPWTRVAVWAWSVPVALVSSWLLVTQLTTLGFEPWPFLSVGGRGLAAGGLAVLTGLRVHVKQGGR